MAINVICCLHSEDFARLALVTNIIHSILLNLHPASVVP
jgi:hypothetical protein